MPEYKFNFATGKVTELSEPTAQVRFADATIAALETLAKNYHAADKSILEVVDRLVTRVLELEQKVEMLMDLHKVE